MQISAKRVTVKTRQTGCLIAAVHEGRKLSEAATQIDNFSNGYLKNILKRGAIEGKKEQSVLLYDVPGLRAQSVLLVGTGKIAELDAAGYRKANACAALALRKAGIKDAVSLLSTLTIKNLDAYSLLRHAAEATQDVLYHFEQTKSEKDKSQRVFKTLELALPDGTKPATATLALKHAHAISLGANYAKELGNLPGNICTPSYLASQARALGKRYGKLKVTVLEEAQMKKLGMGALLGVSRGSRQPAKFIIMQYNGGKADQKPHVLVGKGLTFDAGGISLKPAAAMDEMKYDMCGGASVFGAMQAVCELGLNKNIIGVVPSSENLPDGEATKPGDVHTSMSGKTIEILNTDAEGRLILCDALTYVERYKPATVVDMATLTGACVIALGSHATGLFSQDDKLAAALLAAGETTTDRAWRMPLWDDYQSELKSNFADLANVGGREGGAITAACFLANFTKKYRWAHLDIAGTAWHSGAKKGATGRPVSLLVQYLLNQR
ncbi:MAG TPA: leucyl aminopeptidase [Gammaproteobacteria bacterium]|nr:leucyl aminopeptidase [Gammaproteobacteria bacterium]